MFISWEEQTIYSEFAHYRVQHLQAINLKPRNLPHAMLENLPNNLPNNFQHLPELKHVNLPPKHPLPNDSHEPNANRLNVCWLLSYSMKSEEYSARWDSDIHSLRIERDSEFQI